MTGPSRQNALERMEADLRDGDYGRARQRLESYISSKGYDAELMSRLGRICYEMHDLFNAGRHWLLSTAEGEDVDRAINAFLKAAGHHPHQIAMQVLAAARLRVIEDYPTYVQERLQRLKLDESFAVALRKAKSGPYVLSIKAKIGIALLAIAGLLGIVVMVVGMTTVVKWIRQVG